MKNLLIFGLLLLNSIAGGIEKGISRDAVLAELGESQGSMRNGSKEILLFKTGTVTLQNGIVITSDLSEAYARKAEENTIKVKEIRAAEQVELEKQKLLYPENHITRIECAYTKTENWDYLPESIRPAQGKYGYDVYIPQGYHETGERFYKCLFLESPALWDSVKERVRMEKWLVVVLQDPRQQTIGRFLNANFLAAFDDATARFRITKEYRFIAGRVPSAIFATMRPVAGIILQEPDFRGFEKTGFNPDFLRKNSELRVYVLLGNNNRDRIIDQGQFIVAHIPKYYIEIYQGQTTILPQPLADHAIDWLKKEYALP